MEEVRLFSRIRKGRNTEVWLVKKFHGENSEGEVSKVRFKVPSGYGSEGIRVDRLDFVRVSNSSGVVSYVYKTLVGHRARVSDRVEFELENGKVAVISSGDPLWYWLKDSIDIALDWLINKSTDWGGFDTAEGEINRDKVVDRLLDILPLVLVKRRIFRKAFQKNHLNSFVKLFLVDAVKSGFGGKPLTWYGLYKVLSRFKGVTENTTKELARCEVRIEELGKG